MRPSWFILQLNIKNDIEPKERVYSYSELFEEVNKSIKHYRKVDHSHFPPMSFSTRMRYLKELKIIRKYIKLKLSEVKKGLIKE